MDETIESGSNSILALGRKILGSGVVHGLGECEILVVEDELITARSKELLPLLRVESWEVFNPRIYGCIIVVKHHVKLRGYGACFQIETKRNGRGMLWT